MLIAKTKFLEFKNAKCPDGTGEWSYVRRTNDSTLHDSAVVITTIVKIEGEYKFLFLKTKRPPLYEEGKSEFCIESPAGLIGDVDKSETLNTCIKKELLEETGLSADKIFIDIINSCTSAGLSSETISYATAFVENYNVIQTPVSDNGVIVERFFVPVKDVDNYFKNLDKNYSLAAPTVCGVHFALLHI